MSHRKAWIFNGKACFYLITYEIKTKKKTRILLILLSIFITFWIIKNFSNRNFYSETSTRNKRLQFHKCCHVHWMVQKNLFRTIQHQLMSTCVALSYVCEDTMERGRNSGKIWIYFKRQFHNSLRNVQFLSGLRFFIAYFVAHTKSFKFPFEILQQFSFGTA